MYLDITEYVISYNQPTPNANEQHANHSSSYISIKYKSTRTYALVKNMRIFIVRFLSINLNQLIQWKKNEAIFYA